jgi:hypothetical protein
VLPDIAAVVYAVGRWRHANVGVEAAIMSVMNSRRRASVLLVLALAGIFWFSRSFRLVDTIGLLASGGLTGVALAELAAARKGPRRT